jgi:hypothetical protein
MQINTRKVTKTVQKVTKTAQKAYGKCMFLNFKKYG